MRKLTIILIAFSFYALSFCSDYNVLITAIGMRESGCDPSSFNEAEKAVGWLQIRPIRVKDYNQRLGTDYVLEDFFDPELSRQMFLYYAKGKSFEKAAKDWNGSGPMTIIYWNYISTNLKLLMKFDYSPISYDAYKLLHLGALALGKAEQNGFRVDTEYIAEKKKQLEERIAVVEKNFKISTFYKEWQKSVRDKTINIYSYPQLAEFLFNVKKIPIKKYTATGKGSVDASVIEKLKLSELDFYKKRNRYKKAIDVLSGFEREQVDGFLHPSYNLNLVRTYRSSCSDPNLQNVPARDNFLMGVCRSALYPRKGHMLMELDFKSLEVAINACINQDPNLIKYVSDPTKDMHRDMAEVLYKVKFDKKIEGHSTLRKATKNGFVFPEFYGDYYKNCAIALACDWGKLPEGRWKVGQGIKLGDKHLSDHFIAQGIKELGVSEKTESGWKITGFMKHVADIEKDFWEIRFAYYAKWKNNIWDVYKKYRYIETPTGFRCGGSMSRNEVCNTPAQGSGFHCLLWSFIHVMDELEQGGFDSRLIGQVHDSMLIDVHPDELDDVYVLVNDIVTRQLPEAWKWIIVPISIEADICGVDEPWANKKAYEV